MATRKLWKGVLAGGAAGLAGTLAMTQFQTTWSKVSKKLTTNNQPGSAGPQSDQQSDDATMKAAGKIGELGGHPLTHQEKQKAAPFVHYGFGTTMGMLYGTLMEMGPRDLRRHELLSGVGFGSLLFAGADEIAIPATGLSQEPPSKTPITTHLQALFSHVVYGVTAGAVRKAVRSAL
jgi:hypothetical protein